MRRIDHSPAGSKRAARNKRYYERRGRRRYHERRGGKDERRLSVTIRLRESLVGRLHRLVNEGVATGKYPWKTMSECVALLILDGLRTRKGEDEIDEMLPHLEYMGQIDRIHQLRREAQGGLHKAREEISELLGIGARTQAVQYYHTTLDAAHHMPPTAWRDWMIEELKKAFPDLAREPVTGVRLVEEAKEAKNPQKGQRTHGRQHKTL